MPTKRKNVEGPKQQSQASVQAPAYPYSGKEIFARLRAALTSVYGTWPSYPRLAQYCGVAQANIHYWFTGFRHPHIRCFLSLLERLPESQRIEFLNWCCREIPTLASPRFAQDAVSVSAILGILKQESGLTIIRGGTDFSRTFVLTAIGHTFLQTSPRHKVAGIDIFEPRKWVPIENVHYLAQPQPAKQLREIVLAAWPAIQTSPAQTLLLNGVLSIAPEMQNAIIVEAEKRKVVVAEKEASEMLLAISKGLERGHVITIHQISPGDPLIHVRVDARTVERFDCSTDA